MGFRIEVRVVSDQAEVLTVLPLMDADTDGIRDFHSLSDAEELADEMLEFVMASD